MPLRRSARLFGSALFVALGHTCAAMAQPRSNDVAARPFVIAHSQTTARLFERAVVPGPDGSLVRTEATAPVYEYWSLSGGNLPGLLGEPGARAELAGFLQSGWNLTSDRPLMGDLTAAWFEESVGPLSAKVGRQTAVGGAARYSRFDGARLGLSTSAVEDHWRWSVDGYAGFRVLPQWDQRPGYFQLGATTDTLVRDPTLLPPAQRSGNDLWGLRGELSYQRALALGISYHDERIAAETLQRNIGLDARYDISEALQLNGQVLADADSSALRDGHVWLQLDPSDEWWLNVEYLHVEPRLFLSHQSVLSVFDTNAFDEAGASVSFQPSPQLTTTANAYAESFGSNEYGTRSSVRIVGSPDPRQTLRVQLTYGRVWLPGAGYHTVRTGIRSVLHAKVAATGEAYFYWYDQLIEGRRTSTVYTSNLEWAFKERLRLLWGGALMQTPYAASDLQTTLRLDYAGAFELGGAR